MIEQLKPCPFCGHDKPRLLNLDYIIQVVCPVCGASGPRSAFKPDGAVTGWNRRTGAGAVQGGGKAE